MKDCYYILYIVYNYKYNIPLHFIVAKKAQSASEPFITDALLKVFSCALQLRNQELLKYLMLRLFDQRTGEIRIVFNFTFQLNIDCRLNRAGEGLYYFKYSLAVAVQVLHQHMIAILPLTLYLR